MLLFQSLKERGCDGLWSIQRSKAPGACNEYSGENAGEQNKRIGNDRLHAIWLYAWQGDDSHALFILRRMQVEFPEREQKLYMCFVDLENAFDRVPRKVMEWALRKDWQKCWCKQ